MAFRTQKISQMTPKGADLEATDLLEVSTLESGSYVTRSITGQELIDAIPPTAIEWGDIGGTLSAQTDLNTALSGKVPTSRTLTINGTTQDLSGDRTFTIATGLTIGTTPISSGTVGRVLFEGTGNVLQQSANLFWDNTNGRLGIGTATPGGRFHVKGSVASEIFKAESTIAALYAQFVSSDGACEFGIYTDALYFQPLPSLANGTRFLNGGNTIIMQLAQTGNVGINTTTDAGFRLDVNGTARVKTNLKIETSTDGLTIEGDASGYPTLKINTLRSGTTRRNWMFATEQFAAGDFVLYRSSTGGGAANTQVYSIFNTGNIGINTTTDAGFRLDVNGTARVQGSLTLSASGSLLMNNNNIYVARGTGTATDGMEIRALSSGTDAVKVTTSSLAISSSGGLTYQASAQVAIDSTTRGFLPPRMTTTQKNAIASPATGLQVFDTTLNQMSYYNGTTWTNI